LRAPWALPKAETPLYSGLRAPKVLPKAAR
jgi:hypothetical protein